MPLSENFVELINGRLVSHQTDIETLFEIDDGKPLVVHFHGGLVSREAALKSSNEVLGPAYLDAGVHPVFFVWNSDIKTTLTSDLLAVAEEPAFQRMLRRLSKFAVRALFQTVAGFDRGESDATLPAPDAPEDLERELSDIEKRRKLKPVESLEVSHSLEAEIKTDVSRDTELMFELKSMADAQPLSPLNQKVVERLTGQEKGIEDGDRAGFTWMALGMVATDAVWGVVNRYRTGRSHGLYDTLVQELLRALIVLDTTGEVVWNRIKAQTDAAFIDSPDPAGGVRFVKRLVKDWTAGRRTTLIGHSTGALYIGSFLQFADQLLPPDVKFDVILLAPACTFKYLQNRLPLFRRRVRRIRLFGLKDSRERSYWEVPVLSRGSLLYIVSGLLESEPDTPLVGMERYYLPNAPYNTMPEIQEVLDYINAEDRVWAVTDTTVPGIQSSALTHGGIVHDPKTLASIRHYLME